jgi:hypothetical protein
MKSLLAIAVACGLALGFTIRAEPELVAVAQEKKKYPRGHKHASKKVWEQRHRVSHAKHGKELKALPVINDATWDAVALGYGPAINDQGQCGDCYLNSGANVCASAQLIAGQAPKNSGFQLSIQWLLDCHGELGGCGGGDEYQVAQLIQTDGCPSMKDYAGQGQTPAKCGPTTGMKLYMVTSLAMCSSTQGVANTQDIKNCIAAYGYVSVAVAAGADWDSYQAGQVLSGNSTEIDHAVGLVGWKTTGTTTVWKLQNSWGQGWGDNGYAWINEGADCVGTEAFAAIATPVVPPPPPPGPGPGPAPGPPGTATSMTISGAILPGTYEISTTGTLAAVQAAAGTLNGILGGQPSGKTNQEPPLMPKIELRLKANEEAMGRLADAVLKLQTTIEGKGK